MKKSNSTDSSTDTASQLPTLNTKKIYRSPEKARKDNTSSPHSPKSWTTFFDMDAKYTQQTPETTKTPQDDATDQLRPPE